MENKTFDEIWNEIQEGLGKTGLNLFNISKVYLPSEEYDVYQSHMVSVGERIYWCGKPVKEYVGKVIYFELVN